MGCFDSSRAVEAVRRFNRFYARHAGAFHERLHKSHFSLTEVRILHELAHDRAHTAADLSRNLGLDTGYLSRLISNFQKMGLVVRRKNESDGRAHLLFMTPEAKAKVDDLDLHVSSETASVLDRLAPGEIEQLSSAMADIERLLSPSSSGLATRLRSPRCGDFGWMIERHALLDVSEGASLANEAHAASVVARFLRAMQTSEPGIACWVAEQQGAARVGAAVLNAASKNQARIDLLFVEPGARRCGLGERLVAACANFAQGAGYESVTCEFDDAREDLGGLFLRTGFKLRHDETGVVWERELRRIYAE
ncbi:MULTISPECIES: bifunctional helix-turn-helix transcriptional regulator/GNAT family N-acetyltransferase [unclassified Caballeronia]|uniref:bifunctional helix-turn-helix transcriptional regulator/GNAT family N-acetyltransferase n=1 Tax=unclassified Caballeronia TaxID=2646786 RepID=UPI0028667964|nr:MULTISPECIES: bifunctional helix-turn-helix transcriptional regulator/GNAT family N-acetyltransferase [unclassified Caballeronia]MDR5736815.1 bifunctional helix-turn-helix transcriptional regulator/GNAT family N-acetyltransferase [Caballeronia sp. LZ016]MDR5810704.1 bifunctional helix-turn-helix transcriptional regulator/GNAT family N-acetyltransferase [Caballeronia sp. LZ019]